MKRLDKGTVCRGLGTFQGTTAQQVREPEDGRKLIPCLFLKGQEEETVLPACREHWSPTAGTTNRSCGVEG